jgi:hypothetical protein
MQVKWSYDGAKGIPLRGAEASDYGVFSMLVFM